MQSAMIWYMKQAAHFWMLVFETLAPGIAKSNAAEETVLLSKFKIESAMVSMEERRATLENQMARISEEARKHLARRDQRAARSAMGRRRRVAAQIAKVYSILSSLEVQLDTIENSETNSAVLEAFKGSSSAFAAWQNGSALPNADDIDALRQDLEDQIQNANDITQMASAPLQLGVSDSITPELTIDDMLLELAENAPEPRVAQAPAGAGIGTAAVAYTSPGRTLSAPDEAREAELLEAELGG